MNFYDWIVNIKRLSNATAEKYSNAIYGVISEWMIENNISLRSLDLIENERELVTILNRIRELPIFIERNIVGHNMYCCALNKYEEYRRGN